MEKIFEPSMLCPLDLNYLCLLSIQRLQNPISKDTEANALGKKVLTSQVPHDINQIMAVINRDVPEYYERLQGYKVPKNIIDWLFISVITYVLMNAANYTGNIKHKTDRLFESLHQDAALLFNTLMGYNVPDNLIDIIFSNITEISLREMSGPSPEFIPGPAWSNWENLGGHLTSAPAVASWGTDRLDVFGRGKDGSLLHKWWDGMEWSDWEDLGGDLASAPGAVSWPRSYRCLRCRPESGTLACMVERLSVEPIRVGWLTLECMG